MLELYHAGLTSCSKKVRHCLHEKGLAYQSHFVDLERYEHHDPKYLALNPNGVVPTLVHDGMVVIESGVINEYLDEVFRDRPLRPGAPHARARMRVFTKMADEYGLPATRVPTWTRLKRNQIKAMDEAEFEIVIRDTPLVDHRVKLKALRGDGFSEVEREEALGRMDYIYDRCEAALADNRYLVGDTISLAEIALLPYVDAFAKLRQELLQRHPRTAQWYGDLMARPAVTETYLPSEETVPPANPR